MNDMCMSVWIPESLLMGREVMWLDSNTVQLKTWFNDHAISTQELKTCSYVTYHRPEHSRFKLAKSL